MSEYAEDPRAEGDGLYQSFAALRVAHLDLRHAYTRKHADSTRAETREKEDRDAARAKAIREFLDRAQAAGAFIADEEDRLKAQSILDYWTAELISSPDILESDFTPADLAPFDERRAAARSEQEVFSEAKLAKRREESRETIRLGALSRMWRDSKEQEGYLLSGKALAQAREFRGSDPDIAKLLEASDAAAAVAAQNKKIRDRRKKIRNRALAITSVLLSVMLFTVFGVLHLYFNLLPNWSKSTITRMAIAPTKRENGLWWLGWYQKFMPPEHSSFDLTEMQFKEINLPRFELFWPNFVRAEFENANFDGADLRNSSFHESLIKDSNFSNANLPFSQFRDAKIESSSFAGADLYRAGFDEALLCDVNFSGADLRLASFRTVAFGDRFEDHFKNTAWWLAVGWNKDQIDKLIGVQHDKSAMKLSKSFKKDLKQARKFFEGATEGTAERALALNGLAWTLAIWGIDVERTNNAPDNPSADCVQANDIPDNAVEAAEQAVCIAKRLGQEDEIRKSFVANYQDTLGYVLLQTGQKDEAFINLNEAAQSLSTGGVMFRRAVAQEAIGKKQDAIADLIKSLEAERYVPSHELVHLKRYIEEKFKSKMYELMNKRRSESIGTSSLSPRSCDPAPTTRQP